MDEVCARVLEGWQRRWFGERSAFAIQPIGSLGRCPSGKTWEALGADLWLEWSVPTQLALAKTALDHSGNDRDLSADDRALLLGLAERMMLDLGENLRRLFSITSLGPETPAQPGSRQGSKLELAAAQGRSLELFVGRPLIVRLRKLACAPVAPREVERPRLAEVVGECKVGFEARIGTAKLTALELRGIGCGDVVILEGAPGEQVELRHPKGNRPLAHARLTRENGALTLTGL
jgi:flagellar motor switch/type III secretory pathway protein FliN